MHVIWSKAAVIFFTLLGAVIQIANLFVGNIIVYEATEKVKFDWEKLLHSKLFWFVVIVQLSYYLLSFLLSRVAKANDNRAVRAIERNIVKLINTAEKMARKKDFENAEKTLDILDKLVERRKKWWP